MTPLPTQPPTIPNYRLLRCIGRGAYGEVWLGLDVFNHWAAVKVVRRDNTDAARAYDQEFRGLKLYADVAGSHPGLMRIQNTGKDPSDSFFYYAMEPADNADTGSPLAPFESLPVDLSEANNVAAAYRPLTLTEKLRAGRLPPEDCVRHGFVLAEALAHLHANGLVHRDVKPSNIIFVGGRAKLADVGLVTRLDATLGSLAGTPDFVPLRGAGKPAGDLYALGMVLYLMANGRPVGDFPELLAGHETLPDTERKALAELSAISDRACDPDLTVRYASAEVLQKDLEWLRLDESVIELRRREAEATRREAQFRRLRRGSFAAVAAAVLAGLVFAALSWRAETTHRAALAELEKRQLSRITHRVQGWAERDWQSIQKIARVRPDDTVLRQAAATLSGLDVRRLGYWSGVEATSAAFSPTGDLILSGHGTHRASLITHGTKRIELPVAGEGKVAWARDGEPLIFQVEPRKAVLREARTGRVRREFPLAAEETGQEFHAPVTALSADGTRAAAVLARGEARRLALWDADTGALLGETNLTASVLAFAPDASRLAAGHEDGSVSVFQLRPFALETSLPAALGPNPVQALAFGKDALVPLAGPAAEPRWLLAVGDRATGIVIWELAARRPRSFCRGSLWEVQSLAFHPDGVTLASAGRMGVRFWDVATGQRLLWADGNGSNTRALAFNADGSWLAAGSTGESSLADANLWELEPDRGIQRLCGLTAPIRKVTFSPDGQRLAALSDEWRLGVWEIPSGRLLRIFELTTGIYADNAGRAFDADHRRLAFAAGTSARVFDLATGRTEAEWELPDGLSEELQFAPDGRLLLGRLERDPGPPRLRRWCLYELPLGKPTRLLHRQSGTNDTTINVTLTARAAHLLVLGKNRTTRANFLALKDTASGGEEWRRETSNSMDWDVVPVDPGGTRCAVRFTSVVEMKLLSLDDGKIIATLGNCWALSPTGMEYVAAGSLINYSQLQGPDRHQPSLLLATDSDAISETHTFSPDGRQVAWGSEEGAVFVARLAEVRRRLATLADGRTKP